MRNFITILCLAILLPLSACQPPVKREPVKKENVFLVVDFDSQVPLKYKLISERESLISLSANKKKAKPERFYEKLEMVISYKADKTDAYGVTKITARCHSAEVTRQSKARQQGRDVVEQLAGKTYSFSVSSTGKIVELSEINKLVSDMGTKVFSSNKQSRIKKPDMIADFMTLQLFLWDSVASSSQTSTGLEPGSSWTATQFIPLSIPTGFKRDTTYTLGDVQVGEDGQNRVSIDSTYVTSKTPLENWPKIYSGSFAMRGTFGFLRNYQLASIEGAGNQIFNVDKGLVEKDTLSYKVKLDASIMFALKGVSPGVNVDQKMSVELLEN